MTNLKDLIFKLLISLLMISILIICNEYVANNKDINRYVPFPDRPFVLDTKTGAIYRPNGEGKEMQLICKPISNKIK